MDGQNEKQVKHWSNEWKDDGMDTIEFTSKQHR